MKYDKKLNLLIAQNVDVNYQKFHAKNVPNIAVKGVRIPVLRKIAKEFSVCEDFLENVTLNNYEAISVACYYIGATTHDGDTLKIRLAQILPYVNNWAICDTFVSSLKMLKTTKKTTVYPLIMNYLNSDNDYTVRFGVVCLLSYYLEPEVIDEIFAKIVLLQGRGYYLDMALAWLISEAFVKCRQQTLDLLKSKTLSQFVQNKSIAKICDSFRVSDADKLLVKQYRV